MDRPSKMFACDDCGWRWPLADRGQVIDYCDACGGTMRPADTATPQKRAGENGAQR